MNFQLMSKQRKFVLIFSAIGFVSMFLPWVSIPFFGYDQVANGMHREGVVVFICFVATGIIALVDDQARKIDNALWVVTLLAGLIALLCIFLYYSGVAESFLGYSFLRYGIYVATLAVVGILLSAYLLKSPEDNVKDGFEDLQQKMKNIFSNTPSPDSDKSSGVFKRNRHSDTHKM